MAALLLALYVLVVGALSIYGLLGFVTLVVYWRHRHEREDLPDVPLADLPAVTVQLPVYNERLVVGRLIDAAAELDYPRDRLHIQLVDDSNDETIAIAASRIAYYHEQGLQISHVRREGREGYKAGALAHALLQTDGEFIAVFDADFQPSPDFLLKTVPHF
ncbi:MAG: glycosyltransferase, partial [Candidatus Promineifilaceae bacterium]